jgi:hypothetical protein
MKKTSQNMLVLAQKIGFILVQQFDTVCLLKKAGKRYIQQSLTPAREECNKCDLTTDAPLFLIGKS